MGCVWSRENDGTEREAQAVGRDMTLKVIFNPAEVCFPRRPHAVLPRSQVLNDTSSAIT